MLHSVAGFVLLLLAAAFFWASWAPLVRAVAMIPRALRRRKLRWMLREYARHNPDAVALDVVAKFALGLVSHGERVEDGRTVACSRERWESLPPERRTVAPMDRSTFSPEQRQRYTSTWNELAVIAAVDPFLEPFGADFACGPVSPGGSATMAPGTCAELYMLTARGRAALDAI